MDRRKVLAIASDRLKRPVHLLEKEVWVVWVLRTIFASSLAESLVFKGGTSLSKAYGAIRRFSEDVDLTYDIRALAPDLVGENEEALPKIRSEEKRWSSEVRRRLPTWVWERPTREIAKELGISDVALGKLCEKLQVPKPPRGYWERVEAGQTPRRPALKAFREELEAKRKGALQARIAGHFTELQSKFLDAALEELRKRGVDSLVETTRLKHTSSLDQDVAAQVLLLIQGRHRNGQRAAGSTSNGGRRSGQASEGSSSD